MLAGGHPRPSATPCCALVPLPVQGANQAAAAARLGYPTFFVGQVGAPAHAMPPPPPCLARA